MILKTLEKLKSNYKNISIKNGITRNALSTATGIRYDVIDRYYKSQIMRIDLENLAKICYALECDLSDIIEYEN